MTWYLLWTELNYPAWSKSKDYRDCLQYLILTTTVTITYNGHADHDVDLLKVCIPQDVTLSQQFVFYHSIYIWALHWQTEMLRNAMCVHPVCV